MSEREWKIGDWAQYGDSRRLVVDIEDDIWITTISKSKTMCTDLKSDLVHLPDCDHWDWQPPKPIEPPPGCRLLTKGETILLTDRFLHHYGHFEKFDAADVGGLVVGKQYDPEKHVPIARKIEPPPGYQPLREGDLISVDDICFTLDWMPATTDVIGRIYDPVKFMPMARKIDRYRPFANAAEYKPYKKTCIDISAMAPTNTNINLDAYCDMGVFGIRFQTNSIELIPWDRAFEMYKFEDGTPFGVKLDDDAKPSGSGSK